MRTVSAVILAPIPLLVQYGRRTLLIPVDSRRWTPVPINEATDTGRRRLNTHVMQLPLGAHIPPVTRILSSGKRLTVLPSRSGERSLKHSIIPLLPYVALNTHPYAN